MLKEVVHGFDFKVKHFLKILSNLRYETNNLPEFEDGIVFLGPKKHALFKKNLINFVRSLKNFTPDILAKEKMDVNFERLNKRGAELSELDDNKISD